MLWRASDLSAADVTRLAIKWMLEHRDLLVRGTAGLNPVWGRLNSQTAAPPARRR